MSQPPSGQFAGQGGPYPHNQGWGQQPAWGAQPKKRGSGMLIAIIVGVVVLAGVMALVLVLILGKDRPAREAADGFLKALQDQDVSAIKEYSCDALDAELEGADVVTDPESAPTSYVLLTVEEDENTATADVSLNFAGEPMMVTLSLERNDDGDFEVCGFGESGESGESSTTGD